MGAVMLLLGSLALLVIGALVAVADIIRALSGKGK